MFNKSKSSTPPAVPGDETANKENLDAWREACKRISVLFGDGTDRQNPGVLHQNTIESLEQDEGWKKYLDEVRESPRCKTLAIVASARANPAYPPILVAKLFPGSNPDEGEDEEATANSEAIKRWFAEIYIGGLAEIFVATGGEDKGIGLIFHPAHPRLDIARSAYNVVSHVAESDRQRLGLYMPDEAPRRSLSSDPMKMIGQLEESPLARLTAAQQLYRWAVRKFDRREDNRAARNRNTGDVDPAAGLPLAPQPPRLATQPPAAPALPPPPTPASNANAAPKPPRNNKKQAAPPPPASSASTADRSADGQTASESEVTNGLPAVPTAAPAAAEDEDRALLLAALKGGGVMGQALAALVSQGGMSLEAAAAKAASKGIPGF